MPVVPVLTCTFFITVNGIGAIGARIVAIRQFMVTASASGFYGRNCSRLNLLLIVSIALAKNIWFHRKTERSFLENNRLVGNTRFGDHMTTSLR